MPSNNVSVDHDAFHAANQQYGNVVPEIRATADRLTASVDAAQAGWKGEAYGSFTAFHQRLNDSITSLHRSLDDVNQSLTKGNQSLGSTDTDNSQHFTSL
jgi:WXG100 family type VII secretion target